MLKKIQSWQETKAAFAVAEVNMSIAMDPGKCCAQEDTPEALESCPPKHESQDQCLDNPRSTGPFQQLALLDRFLALWIFLAIAIGIILGNFVPDVGRSLQRGKFVGVSIPIGMLYLVDSRREIYMLMKKPSGCWS